MIDNAPTTERTAQLVRAEFPGARYIREDRPGLGAARERVLAEAQSDIAAFLDDDAVADPGWIGAFRQAFCDNPALAACTGRVLPLKLDTDARRLLEAGDSYDRGDEPISLPRDASRRLHGRRAPLIAWAVSIGCGCSLAIRRDPARRAGGIDTTFGAGAPIPAGEDHDILWRLLAAGHELRYEPSALVHHEGRAEIGSLARQLRNHQQGLAAMLGKAALRAHGRARLEILAFLGWRLAKPGVRLGGRLLGRDPLPASVLLGMWSGTLAGAMTYPFAGRSARRTWRRN